MYNKVISARLSDELHKFIEEVRQDKGLTSNSLALQHVILLAMRDYKGDDALVFDGKFRRPEPIPEAEIKAKVNPEIVPIQELLSTEPEPEPVDIIEI